MKSEAANGGAIRHSRKFAKVSVRQSLHPAASMLVVVKHQREFMSLMTTREPIENTCIDFDDRSVKDHVLRRMLYGNEGVI